MNVAETRRQLRGDESRLCQRAWAEMAYRCDDNDANFYE